MKCVGIQHVEAMRELSEKGIKLLRTVHISFVPDEEIGGMFYILLLWYFIALYTYLCFIQYPNIVC